MNRPRFLVRLIFPMGNLYVKIRLLLEFSFSKNQNKMEGIRQKIFHCICQKTGGDWITFEGLTSIIRQ